MNIDYTEASVEQLVTALVDIDHQDLVNKFHRTGYLTVDEVYNALLEHMGMEPIYPKSVTGWIL